MSWNPPAELESKGISRRRALTKRQNLHTRLLFNGNTAECRGLQLHQVSCHTCTCKSHQLQPSSKSYIIILVFSPPLLPPRAPNAESVSRTIYDSHQNTLGSALPFCCAGAHHPHYSYMPVGLRLRCRDLRQCVGRGRSSAPHCSPPLRPAPPAFCRKDS